MEFMKFINITGNIHKISVTKEEMKKTLADELWNDPKIRNPKPS